jgi:polysaccharide biosynthesis transport protein
MNSQLTYDDLKSFLRRRRTLCLVTFSVIFAGAVILAIALPPVYRSQATIRITEQQISEDYIKSVSDISPEERLQRLTSTIMRHTEMKRIIEKYHLYPKLQAQGMITEAVQQIKKDIKIEPTTTEVINPRSGRTIPITSALTLSFQGVNPEQVKNVTQELANLYVEQDIKKREERSTATTGFLEDEIDRLKLLMQAQEKKISEFKRDHISELPENSMSNRQIIANLGSDLNQIDSRISYLEDRKIYLNGELATISPLATVKTDQGNLIRNPHDRLKIQQMQLSQLQARFSDKHPDVIKAKRDLAELEKELGVKAGQANLSQLIKEKRAELSQMKGKYGPNHPQVIKLNNEIDSLSNQSQKEAGLKSGYEHEKPDNPAYINILSQIQAADAEIRSQTENKGRIILELQRYRAQMKNAPIIETQMNEMMRNYDNTKKNYNELMGKLMSAKVSQAIDLKDRGAKFFIADPAYLPSEPYKPNRLAIIVLGFVAAIGSAFGIAAVKEATDHSIKSEKELSGTIDIPVLTTIPLVGKKSKKRTRR